MESLKHPLEHSRIGGLIPVTNIQFDLLGSDCEIPIHVGSFSLDVRLSPLDGCIIDRKCDRQDSWSSAKLSKIDLELSFFGHLGINIVDLLENRSVLAIGIQVACNEGFEFGLSIGSLLLDLGPLDSNELTSGTLLDVGQGLDPCGMLDCNTSILSPCLFHLRNLPTVEFDDQR